MAKAKPFPGFSLGMLHFFEELGSHNNKKWFDANKQRYEDQVRGPALQFIEAMQKPLAKISPHFLAVPKKVGGSLMRIHRDVRFAKDKSPYKTNLGIQFRHESGRDVHAPGFYFHIDVNEVFLGAGLWHPDSESLSAIRERISEEPGRWKRARDNKRFREIWSQSGESLKRPPRGYDADHPMIEDLKRKDHIAVAQFDHDDLFTPEIVPMTVDAFRRSRPYVSFLCEAVGATF